MRDFYDVYEIMNSKADQISFDVLKKAFAATCMKRETSFGEEEVRETLDNFTISAGHVFYFVFKLFRCMNHTITSTYIITSSLTPSLTAYSINLDRFFSFEDIYSLIAV